MSMPQGSVVMLLVMVFAVAPARAEKWASPDGAVAVAVPNADDFVRMDDPPDPFLVLWISTDDNLYFGVRKSELSPDTTLTRSEAEKEIVEETRGAITSSSTVIKHGREFWVITAEAPGHGATLQITQAITQIGTNVYNVYVGAVQAESADRAAIDSFLNSFEITQDGPGAESEPVSHVELSSALTPRTEPESAPIQHAGPEPDVHVDAFHLSEWIGALAVLFLVGVMLWWLVGRGGK